MGVIESLGKWQKNKHKEQQAKKLKEASAAVESKKVDTEIIRFKKEIKAMAEEKSALELYKKFKTTVQYDVFAKKGVLDFSWYLKAVRNLFDKGPQILVEMQLRNGDWVIYKVKTTLPYFVYADGSYIIDTACQEWDDTHKLYKSFYHQNLSFPLKFDIPVNEITKTLAAVDANKVDLSANPMVLARYIKSEFVDKIMKGAKIASDLEAMRMMIIINLILTVICIVLLIAMMRK